METVSASIKNPDAVMLPKYTLKMLLVDFVRQHPMAFLFYIVALVIVPVQSVYVPHLYGQVVDAIKSNTQLWQAFLKLFVVILVIQIAGVINDWNEVKTYPVLHDFIRRVTIDNIMYASSTNYTEQLTGKIVSQLLKMPGAVYQFLEQWKLFIIPQIIVYIIAAIYIWKNDKLIAIVLLCIMVIVYVVVTLTPRWCNHLSVKRDAYSTEVSEQIEDFLRNMISVMNYNQQKDESNRIDAFQTLFSVTNAQTVACAMKYKLSMMPFQLGFVAFFFWRCYTLLRKKQITAGVFVSMFMIMVSVLSSWVALTNQLKDMTLRSGMISTMLDGLHKVDGAPVAAPVQEPTVVPVQASQSGMGSSALEMRQVTFLYPNSTIPTLENVSLSIRPGEHIVMVGRIGSGKSTLLKLIMKYNIPTHGEVYLYGRPYKSVSVEEARRRIGYVPQYPILFNRSLFENVVYGQRDVSKGKVIELLRSLHLESMFQSLPDGLDTQVGKNGSRLSGGQRQVVWILRVMLQDPDILLLDEPTASIDEGTKDKIQALLHVMMQKKNRTVIMVTHDNYLLDYAQRVVEFRDGHVVRDEPIAAKQRSAKTVSGDPM